MRTLIKNTKDVSRSNGKSRHIKHRSALFAVANAGAGEKEAEVSRMTTMQKVQDIGAKLAGYVIGLGAMTVYAPIFIKILRAGNADGFAISTWVFNLLGLSSAAIYPAKKGFPIPAYIELISLSIQSALLLGVISFYKGFLLPYTLFMAAFGALLYAFFKSEIPPKVLSALQIVAVLACNYANIPQIVLNYQTKVASWDLITASLSVGGNFVRILTTLYYSKDMLILGGYTLGFLTNSILLAQIFLYK
jgi:hypothetical protein